MADEALSDARYLLLDSRLKAAANRAYYAMFYAASAALASANAQPPKTHRTLANLFYRYFVEVGKIGRQYHRDLVRTFQLRQQTDYGLDVQVGEDEVRQAVEKAEVFVAEVKRVVAGSASS